MRVGEELRWHLAPYLTNTKPQTPLEPTALYRLHLTSSPTLFSQHACTKGKVKVSMMRYVAWLKETLQPSQAVQTTDTLSRYPVSPPMASTAQNLLCTSAKFSLNRAGKQSGVNPRRYIDAATTYAMTLYLQAR